MRANGLKDKFEFKFFSSREHRSTIVAQVASKYKGFTSSCPFAVLPTVNPLLSPPGGLFFSMLTFEGGLI